MAERPEFKYFKMPTKIGLLADIQYADLVSRRMSCTLWTAFQKRFAPSEVAAS